VGPARAFDPPSDREPFLNATDARVFLLTGVSAFNSGAADLLEHWLDHHVDRAGVPARYVLAVVHAPSADDRSPEARRARTVANEVRDILRRRDVFHDTYEGEALLFSSVAHHWEHRLAAVADDADWIVVSDLDEHIALPPGTTLPAFLGAVDTMGYSLVHGAWVDRVAEGGETRAAPSLRDRGERMADAFPLQCAVGSCLDPHHVGFEAGWERNVQTGEHTHALRGLHHYSTLVGVVGGGRRVLAHRAQYPILDARTLQDFGLDDVVSATRLLEDHEAAYPVPLKVMHYQWTAGVEARLRARARGYASCHLLDQESTARLLADRLARNDARLDTSACPELSCVRETFVSTRHHRSNGVPNSENSDSRAASGATTHARLTDDDASTTEGRLGRPYEPDASVGEIPVLHDDDVVGNGGAGANGYGAERRVIIFASVWEHVDGVSRTMKRLAHHLRSRADSRVFVMSPDLVESDFREAATHERYHVTDVPHIPMPGRGEYKMAAPLQQRQRHQMETFAPHVVHVAAPDMLGHSAVRWAAENDVCSVCSYHTAYDTYLQYYRVGVLATPLRQMLSGFYSSCDVVATPSYAAAEHLSEMGVPRERVGFFPRGINRTMYSPARRGAAFRRDVFGVGDDLGEGSSRESKQDLTHLGRKGGGGRTSPSLDDAGAGPRETDGEVVILWVARIVREKGLGSFVKTVQELFRAQTAGEITGLPPFRVVVAGDGPDLPWTRRQLDPQLYPRVRILGHAGGDRLAEIYANGDVFFFPSRTEVFPNNLIEAMASGLPVVTDDVGVNRAIVKDGVTGVLVKDADPLPGDVSGWLEALVDVLKNPQKRDALGMAARSSTTGLTWERTFASLRRSYDRCRPGRPYARHMDANVPWSAAAKKRRASERDFDASSSSSGDASSSAGSYASGETSSGGSSLSLSGALLGISAHAAGGGGAAGALAAASALFTDHHHVSASHHHAVDRGGGGGAPRREKRDGRPGPPGPRPANRVVVKRHLRRDLRGVGLARYGDDFLVSRGRKGGERYIRGGFRARGSRRRPRFREPRRRGVPRRHRGRRRARWFAAVPRELRHDRGLRA
jgi:glycosyltransferase involved in cell wall biosynthesis